MRIVDLRSDTVTLPTEEMMEAIRTAELGDDGYGEDPTVNRLEELAARKFGKENAILVPSGLMGNLVSVMAHTIRGDEVILGAGSDIFFYEVGNLAVVCGVTAHAINDSMGVLDPRDVEAAIRKEDVTLCYPETGLICLENTHGRSGGSVVTSEQIKAVSNVAKAYNLPIHLDGARIFNAAVALGVDVHELTKDVDSVMFCLSKGLCCPIGSMIVGCEEFIRKARRYRKMVGGGMRQAGIIAASGIIALEKMVDRLKEDHENAKYLARRLEKIEGISIDVERVSTNIVIFDVRKLGLTGKQFVEKLGKVGIKAYDWEGSMVRFVTHMGINKNDIDYALEVVEKVARAP